MHLLRHIDRRFLTSLGIACLAATLLPAAGIAGKEPKKRVAVVDFENEAGYVQHQWGDLGGGMAEKLIESLIETEKFVVLERQALADVVAEHNLGKIANVEPAVVGRLTSAQALIRGVITNVEGGDGEEGGFGLGKFRISGKNQRVSVEVNLRIVDTITGQILQSKTVEGIAKLRGIRVRQKYGDTDVGVNRNHPVGKAMDDAVAKAVEQIVAGMESIPWQGSVSRVSGRQIIVNAGSQENVEPGLKLRVFEKGAEIIDKETNESLGRLDEEIGIIQVERVEPRFSIAEILQGEGFAAGNIVRPVTEVN